MRSFENLSKIENLSLNQQFPEILDLILLEIPDSYRSYSVCVFDRWLSAEKTITEIDRISLEGESNHNQNLFNFILDVTDQTETYLIKFLGRKKSEVTLKKFLSRAGREKHLIPKNHLVSDSFRFALLFPELDTVYFEGCDFTHHFYSKGNTYIEMFEDMAKKNNLFILK